MQVFAIPHRASLGKNVIPDFVSIVKQLDYRWKLQTYCPVTLSKNVPVITLPLLEIVPLPLPEEGRFVE
jgi:hypothetical protein